MCREKTSYKERPTCKSKSPLRVQGKVDYAKSLNCPYRITPACAGKSLTENIGVVYLRGSPLRVQGKVKQMIDKEQRFRITPACAGKSVRAVVKKRTDKDHPCVCREKYTAFVRVMRCVGSPLRVQGKAVTAAIDTDRYRITPACAGKSCSR